LTGTSPRSSHAHPPAAMSADAVDVLRWIFIGSHVLSMRDAVFICTECAHTARHYRVAEQAVAWCVHADDARGNEAGVESDAHLQFVVGGHVRHARLQHDLLNAQRYVGHLLDVRFGLVRQATHNHTAVAHRLHLHCELKPCTASLCAVLAL
jgi:hypothetical protein